MHQHVCTFNVIVCNTIQILYLLGSTVHTTWCNRSEIFHETLTVPSYWLSWRTLQVQLKLSKHGACMTSYIFFRSVFSRLASFDHLKILRESLTFFMKHFLHSDTGDQMLNTRVSIAINALRTAHSSWCSYSYALVSFGQTNLHASHLSMFQL